MRQYIDGFETKYKSVHLYLWSANNSTQKSTVVKADVKQLFVAGYSCYFTTMDALIKILQNESFNDQSATAAAMVRAVDFLAIDDAFDKHKVTVYKSKYQLSFIDSFLRDRLEIKKRATVFTSNFAVSDIEQNFERHLYKLIQRNCVVMEFRDGINDFNLDSLFE